VSRGKIKLAAVLAGLILAGGLLPIAARVFATTNQQEIEPLEPQQEEQQINEADSSPNSGQFGTFGRRELFYKMLLSVSLVIVLAIAAVYVSKKLLPRFVNMPGKQIRVMETAYIAPRKGIHLIQVGNRRLLIGSTNDTVTMLADVTEPEADFAAELEARSAPDE